MRKQLVGVCSVVFLFAAGRLPAQDEGDLFGRLDGNKDGVVTSDEVPQGQQALFERLLRNADRDGDKKLTKDEFQAGLRSGDEPRRPLESGQPSRGGPGNAPNGAEVFAALFDRTDSNSDGKLTKEEIPEDRQVMRNVLERSGGDSIAKDAFVRGMMTAMQAGGPPRRPDGAPERRPEGPPDRRPEGAPDRRPEGAPDRRPEGAPDRRPEGAPDRRPEGAPNRRPDGPPRGGPPGPGLFAILDTDRDGQLSTAEIVGAGTALLKLDRNGDGKLTPDETFGPGGPGPFGRMPGGGRPGEGRPGEFRPGQRGFGPMSPEALRDRLKQADANNDGKISKDEAPPMLRNQFDRLDSNSDGFIDDTELRNMPRRPGEGGPPGRRGGDRPRPPQGENASP
jgi:hypothetical protein